MTTNLILGTAGHIDHGKTSLIRALTGIDTDRLPEERKRGITIDLGFAELCVGPFRLGIVDVPGHERFVRNMLAGATGMDLALLVVAADDSVKPQTREHLDILRLLDLQAGVVAITKCDLADPSWVDLVEDEIRALVAGTFLAGAPLVRTSVPTRQGLDTLCTALEAAARKVVERDPRRSLSGPFRMAIDRAFTIEGHGTIVTGSVSSGRVRLGEELRIEPGGLKVRVRGLRTHHRMTDEVQRGQRAAINLAGVHHGQIGRGQELAAPDHLLPSRLITMRLHAVESATRPLRNRARVRVHLGTAELLATVILLDTDQVAAGQSAIGQLFLREPAVCSWNQPFVIRAESPPLTVGGGQVLVPSSRRLRRGDAAALAALADLQSADACRCAAAALFFAGFDGWRPAELARTAGIHDAQAVCDALRENGTLRELALSPTRRLQFHQTVLEQLCQRIEKTLAKLHQRFPLRLSIDRQTVQRGFSYVEEPIQNLALETLRERNRIQLSEKTVALADHGPQLSQNEAQATRPTAERVPGGRHRGAQRAGVPAEGHAQPRSRPALDCAGRCQRRPGGNRAGQLPAPGR